MKTNKHKKNCKCGRCKIKRNGAVGKNNFNFKYDIPKKKLSILYWKQNLSCAEIAKLFDCHPETINHKMVKYNIKRRNLKESAKINCKIGKKASNYINGYTNKKAYCIECGNLLGKLAYYNKTKLCKSCAKKGKNSPNWNNGSSFEPYPLGWTRTFKEQIRFRDKYICQLCGVPEVECLRKLDVHHKDYNKMNILPNNLISLCRSCHVKTNRNRDYWTKYFTKIIKEK